jgi:creatinine amidohydrolase/Fe(II)-dependent formamide hydrolase-like protein
MDSDLKKIPGLDNPYPFETFERNKKTDIERSTFFWGHLTWPEVEKYLKKVDLAILPVGAIEQHGPHLPLDTDSFDAEYLAKQVAAACSEPRPLVLPLVPYGVSYHHEGFKGTISIQNDTLSKIVYEIGMGLARNGIKKIVIINGHGGNIPSLNFAAQMINRDARIFVAVDSGETSDVDIYNMIETPNDVHAGEFETSTALAIRPELVKESMTRKSVPEFSSRYLNFTSKRGVSWYVYTKRISETGVLGDPTKADAEKGKKMWKIMIAHLVSFIEDLKIISLDELYQKRY